MNETVVVPAGTQTIIAGRTAKPLATGSWIIQPLRGNKKEEKILNLCSMTSQTPIKQAVRRPPFHLKTTAEEEVQKMLRDDIIEPSNSSWASTVVLVRKNDGSIRYCIDYRRLNAVTWKDSYPLPRIHDSLDALGKHGFSLPLIW